MFKSLGKISKAFNFLDCFLYFNFKESTTERQKTNKTKPNRTMTPIKYI